jgi:fructose-1,6-bisphosphatase/inositol monophosphatase family enzyme
MPAAGQIDICLELALQPYDIAALIPIIERAGCVVSNLNGDQVGASGHVLACPNTTVA